MNVVIGSSEGYKYFYYLEDFIFLKGDGVPLKVLLKNKEFKLKHNFTDVFLDDVLGLFVLANPSGVQVFNTKGQELSKIVEDAQLLNTHVLIYDKGVSSLYNSNFELLFKGEFDRIDYITENLFLIEKGFSRSLINNDNDIIIPSNVLKFNHVLIHEEFQNKPLEIWGDVSQSFYTQKGEKICDWIISDQKECYPSNLARPRVSKKMVSELSDEKRKMLNSDDVWIEGTRGEAMELVKGSGEIITPIFKEVIRTNLYNHYIVKTLGDKYGVIKIYP